MVDPEALSTFRRLLEQTRQFIAYAIMQLKQCDERRHLRWRCRRCEFIKEFIRPMPIEAATLPQGRASSFEPVPFG